MVLTLTCLTSVVKIAGRKPCDECYGISGASTSRQVRDTVVSINFRSKGAANETFYLIDGQARAFQAIDNYAKVQEEVGDYVWPSRKWGDVNTEKGGAIGLVEVKRIFPTVSIYEIVCGAGMNRKRRCHGCIEQRSELHWTV
jgi:hypothetical protein